MSGRYNRARGDVACRPLSYEIASFVLALLYGGVLSQIPQETFKDWSNYLAYGGDSWQHLVGLWNQSLIVILANEPLWLLMNSGLALVLTPEGVARFIVFMSASTVAWLVLRHDPRNFGWLLLFLLLPQVIQKHLMHVRQGAAIAVFLLGWFSDRRLFKWILIGTTPFIHASFAFLLPILWLANGMQKFRLGADIRTLIFATTGVGVGLSLGVLAALVGARQTARYEFTMADVSGLGFVFWLMVLCIMAWEGRQFLRAYAFEAGVVVFYLSTYWLIEVTARVLESGIILVLIAGLYLTGPRRITFLLSVAAFGSIQWIMRISDPLLGFGFG